jgi:uncharacterized protein (DUF1330 family)
VRWYDPRAVPPELDPNLRRRYLEPTQAAGRALLQRGITGPVVMLNLLRFRPVADYAASPELAPAVPISGAEAFARYVAHTLPLLRASGGDLVFLGAGAEFLIGPADERWDQVMLVRQHSVEAFLAFATDAAYLAGLGHRTAAVEDSRLLPLVELPIPSAWAGRRLG